MKKPRCLSPRIVFLSLILNSQLFAQTLTTLHSFGGSDGNEPFGALVLSGAMLYGTTEKGGASGDGTVFAINTNGTSFTSLHSFSGGDGEAPQSGLVFSGNTLYGTTFAGGASSDGTLFAIRADGTGFTNLYSFHGSDGSEPNGSLVLSGDTLYGTTWIGGSSNWGTVFAINTNGAGFTVLHSFDDTDGANPSVGLIVSNNTLYGTTFKGTVFAIHTDGTGFANLYSFSSSVGLFAGLLLSGNTLYGTTEVGGASDDGMVFAITTNGTGFTTLHSFDDADGNAPSAGLIISGSTLYGTAEFGGAGSDGTVFAISTNGTGFTLLHSFDRGDGYQPVFGVILAGGTLYGTTIAGGADNEGAVFALNLPATKTVPVITWPPPASIAAGTPLSSAQLDATANVPGTFAYTPTSGTMLSPGTYTLSVLFTPGDTADYSSASATVSLVVKNTTDPDPALTFSNFNLATGSGPAMVLPVDVNGNGYPGLVCANFGFRFGGGFGTGGGSGTTLSVFTNDGHGNLSAGAPLTVGLEPTGLAVADVNGDGAMDIISANVGANTLTVLTNNRKGGFTLESSFNVGRAPDFVAAADVNGDGKVDLISANYGDSTITVLTNDGRGFFKLSATLAVGSGPNCVAAVDINGDGKVDLVCANSGDSTLLTLTNDGRGVFSSNATVKIAGGVGWVIGADVDDDGTVDLVAAGGPTLTVLTNDGRGNFNLKSAPVTSGSGMVVAADFNGDGRVDLVCPNNGNGIQGSATVLTNDGRGNFTANAVVPIGVSGLVNYPNFVAAADFNRDGNMDFAASCFGEATLTEATQINALPRPIVAITSPANDSVIPAANSFVIDTTASSSDKIEVTLFFLGANILGASTNAPFDLEARAGSIPVGSHALQVETVDSAGHIGWSPEIQINITSTSKTPPPPPPPVVSITSPTNGASLSTSQSFAIKTTTQPATGLAEVDFDLDGQPLGKTTAAPYVLQVPAGSIAAGIHELQATAINSAGGSGSSAVVQITVNAPGTALIDFDTLNAGGGPVGGTALANYLAGYRVTLEAVTVGTAMEAVDTNSLVGIARVEAPSAPNVFTQAGLNQPVSFTLAFAAPLQAFGFTRAGLAPQSGLASHPQWTATAFDSNGTELSSVTEGLIQSATPVTARSFVLTGNGIASVRFDSDSQGAAAFSAVLLDNLILNENATTPALSVALSVTSPPINDIVAPATITLSAAVSDLLGSSYSVSFFAGATLLGTANTSPYQFTWTNVLPGNYSLQARVVDASGYAALSPVVPITVQLEPFSTVVNFDTLDTSRQPVTGAAVANYLAGFGVAVASISPGTALTVDREQHIAGGAAVLASSPPNVLTQTGSSGPAQFTLKFAPFLSQFGFTRPALLANPFLSHPAWQVTAFDGAGAVVDQVAEAEIESSTNVGAREFSFGRPGGPGIAEVEFASQGSGLTTFSAMLVDDLVLTTNKSAFPPAVAITNPVSGVVLAAPPAVTITAAASDATGVASVSFYANGALLGTDTASPYAFDWQYPAIGNYALTAVASNVLGLTWTSSVVNVIIEPSAYQFGIVSQPVSQTVAAGGSVTFSVAATGTNVVSYQWYHNGAQIPGAASSALILSPPITDSEAGSYTVTATAQGTTLTSAPAMLTVVDPPAITTQPAGQTVPSGSDVALSVVAAGGGPFTYQWLLNGTTIPGATSSVYSIGLAQPRDSGNYQVVVANLAASALSAVAAVIVETPITIPETNDTFATRASVNPLLGPVADSNHFATFQKGEPLPGGLAGGNSIWFAWRSTFTGTISLTTQGSDFDTAMAVYTGTQLNSLKAVAADDDSGGFLTSLVSFNVTAGTTYQIAVDGYQGASGRVVLGLPAGTGYRILNPSSADSAPVIVKGPVSQAVAPGATVALSAQASSATKISYQWYFQSAPIPGATSSSLVIKNFQDGSVGLYDVLAANAAGSVQSEPASLQISQTQGGKPLSSENKFVNSTAPASPAAMAFDLRPTDLGGDTRGFSVAQVFSTLGAVRQPGEPQPCGQVGGAPQWFVYQAPTSGILQVNTDGSLFNTLIGVYTGNGTSFSNLVEAGCGYTTNYLTQGQPSVVIPNVTQGTIFYILVDGFQGASGLAHLQIGLGQLLSFRSLPSSRLVTAGSNTTFQVTAVGGTPMFYQWQLNGVSVARATNSTYTVADAQAGAVGNYTVIVSNIVGVVTSSPPAALTLQYAPAIVAGPSNQTVTLGQRAQFSVATLGVNVKTNAFHYQWNFNGAPLPKATNASLSFAAAAWTNTGGYSLVISNTYGSATSITATLTVLDKTLPTVVIKTPVNNLVTNAGVVTVTGAAADNVGVAQAQVEVNANGFQEAAGSNNWSITVTLAPGANVVSARSVDLSGNLSPIVKHTITYKPAPPSRGIAEALSSSLAAAAGTYNGLFYPAEGAVQASSGYFTATVASGGGGAFSANILLDGGSYPFAGKFDASGGARSVVSRAGKTPVVASLRLDLDAPGRQMTGIISNADWRSILQAGRADFAAATPEPAGQFALMIPSQANTTVGYLNISNNPGGTALVSGTLADGARIFRAAPIVKGAAIPLYVPLYSGKGLFLGWITFANSPAQSNFGQAVWIRPGFANLPGVLIVK